MSSLTVQSCASTVKYIDKSDNTSWHVLSLEKYDG